MPKTAPKRAYSIAKPLKEGLEITDGNSDIWILGEAIGKGGFGCIYAGNNNILLNIFVFHL